MISQLSELRGFGYLFRNFLSRDLSSRYKGSLLGVAWSLMNPLVMMVIYTIVFSVIFTSNQPDFAILLLAAYLPFFFFQTAVSLGVPTLVANAGLINKVYFPRELLPLSMTAASFVNFLLTMVLLLPVAAYAREGVNGWALLTLDPGGGELLPGHGGARDAALGPQRLLPRRRVPQRHHPDGAVLPDSDRLHAGLRRRAEPARSSSGSRAIRSRPSPRPSARPSTTSRCRTRCRSASASSSAIGGFLIGYAVFNRLKGRLAEEL